MAIGQWSDVGQVVSRHFQVVWQAIVGWRPGDPKKITEIFFLPGTSWHVLECDVMAGGWPGTCWVVAGIDRISTT